MAIAYQVIYEYTDHSGDKAESAIDIPTGFSLTQYTEFARSMATLVDAIVSGVVSRASLAVTVDLSGLTGNTAAAYSDVEDVGAFQFVTGDNRPVEVNVPGLWETMVLSGSDDLDQVNADIAAFISAMENGIAVTGGTIQPCDVAEDDVVSVVYARERFRSTA